MAIVAGAGSAVCESFAIAATPFVFPLTSTLDSSVILVTTNPFATEGFDATIIASYIVNSQPVDSEQTTLVYS